LTILVTAMAIEKTIASQTAVIDELIRMRNIGYLVVDEAFEVARDFDLSDFASLSVSILAFIACERGYAEFKSRQRTVGAICSLSK